MELDTNWILSKNGILSFACFRMVDCIQPDDVCCYVYVMLHRICGNIQILKFEIEIKSALVRFTSVYLQAFHLNLLITL